MLNGPTVRASTAGRDGSVRKLGTSTGRRRRLCPNVRIHHPRRRRSSSLDPALDTWILRSGPSDDTPAVPPLREQLWALRPGLDGASRPSTTSHRTRDEQSARGLDVRGHGAQQRPRTRVFWLGRHRTGAIPTYTCPRRLEFRATGSLCERRVKALCAFSASLRPFGRLAARAGSELIVAGRNRPASEYTEPLRRRLRKVRQGVMANRSDRDPLNLKGPRGTKPVKRMRCGSADSIGAGRRKSCTNRPDIEPQPVRQTRQNRPLPKRETSI